MAPLAVTRFLPNARPVHNSMDYRPEPLRCHGRVGGGFGQKYMLILTVVAFFYDVIEYGIPNKRGQGQFKWDFCFLLDDTDPFGSPIHGIECDPGDIACPEAGVKKQEKNRLVSQRHRSFFCTCPQYIHFIRCQVLNVFPFIMDWW